jgi:hypothetical protein
MSDPDAPSSPAAPTETPAAAPASPSPSAPEAPAVERGVRAPVAPEAIIYGKATLSAWAENQNNTLEHQRLEALAAADAEADQVATAHERPGEVGEAYVRDMGRPGQNPVVIVQVSTKDGSKEQFIQCDLNITESDGELAMSLNLICPKCAANGVPQARCQIKIDGRNKRMHLDESTKMTPWRDPDTGDWWMTAGTVEVPEICRCPLNCGLKFRISSKGPTQGICRMVRE